MADGATTVTLTFDEEETTALHRQAERLGLSIEEMIQRRALNPDWYSGEHDPAIDEWIAKETLRRGNGMPLEAFVERMKTFGRRPA